MRQLTHRRPQCSFAWEKQLPNRRGDTSHTTRHTHLHIATQHQPWHAHSHSGCLFIKTQLGVSRSSPLTRGWRRAPPLRLSQSHPTRCPAPRPRSPSRPKTQFLMPLQKGGQPRSIRYCRFCLGNDEVGVEASSVAQSSSLCVGFAPRTASQVRGHHSIPPPTQWSGLIAAGCLDSSSAHTAVGVCELNIGVCVHTPSHNTRTLTHTHPHTSSRRCIQTHGHTHTRQTTRKRKHASEHASSHALGRARARENCLEGWLAARR
jgi:hypothetical protein